MKSNRRLFYFIIIILLTHIGCSLDHRCGKMSKYLVKIDTNKAYFVKSTYCRSALISNKNLNDSTLITFEVFDRINGKRVEKGGIVINNTKLKLVNGKANVNVKSPSCKLLIYSLDYDFFKINKLALKPNSELYLTVYLGSNLQF